MKEITKVDILRQVEFAYSVTSSFGSDNDRELRLFYWSLSSGTNGTRSVVRLPATLVVEIRIM